MKDNVLTGKVYWRSLDELAQTSEFRAFVESEFPNHAGGLLDGPSRRQFLKIMGASFALAGLAGCRRWPEEKLAPFAYRPDGRNPGTTLQYATAMELGGVATGLLVTSYDGRPIKIEGNPLHPGSLGAASAMAQASVLELYDPDRSRSVVHREQPGTKSPGAARTWDDFVAFARPHFDELKKKDGAGLAVLSEAASGPTTADMRARWGKAFPQARWYEYEPISRDNEREGTRRAFGKPLRPQLHLDKADVIVCLGADMFGAHPNALRYARDWANRRRGDSSMPRLYVAESTYTITGSVADRRMAVPNWEMGKLLAAIRTGKPASPFAEAVRRDLAGAHGRSFIVAGPGLPQKLHAELVAFNAELGNVGQTITYAEELDANRPSFNDALKSLVTELRAGKIDTLLILGGNPVYNAPVEFSFADVMAQARTVIHLSGYEDETSRLSHWHVPRAHYLEAWGDARAWDGTINVVQPLIEPLYGGKSSIELLAALAGDEKNQGYDLVRRTFADLLPRDNFEPAWRKVLHDGVLPNSAFAPATMPGRLADVHATTFGPPAQLGLELTFVPDSKLYDGRFANNGWLQELPDPLTKLTWDNAALVSLADAKQWGVKTGDLIRIEVNGRGLDIAAYVLPGQATGAVTVSLGYGRTAAGRVGNGTGFNAYALRRAEDMHFAQVKPIGPTYPLALTQDHHAIDRVGFEERKQRVPNLVREVPLPIYQKDPKVVQEMGEKSERLQLWEDPAKYEGHRWGMAIDLTSCIGCGACVVACQAENNIPIVGKQEVIVGREMHWIRVDRYFSGEPDDPSPGVAYQPMTCQHCENAPCENVCPVAATVHDTEGLNTMVYNRCIGTRYCSNNCPYKVRRFNYFDYHSKGPNGARLPWLGMPDTQQQESVDLIRRMGFNPEVSVRMRGVMEKCTYCVQRILAVKIRATNEKRAIADGEIVPACAQTCPTQTIVFGDLNDPNSRVRKLQESNRSYFVLDSLNVRPRTKYLARLTNPGEELKTESNHRGTENTEKKDHG